MARFNQFSGIGEITVEKNELIGVLEKNRDNHHQVFEEAIAKFREHAIHRLDSLIRILREGKVPSSLMVNLPIPEEHTEDYDRAIRMLKMHQGDTITLTEQAYAQLVDDQWGWRDVWASNTLAYATSDQPPHNSNYVGLAAPDLDTI